MAAVVMASLCLALGSVTALTHGVNRGGHSQQVRGSELAACTSSRCSSGGEGPAVDESAQGKDVLYLPSTIIAAPWPDRAAGTQDWLGGDDASHAGAALMQKP
jgi:hypothetical protein